MRGRHGLVAKCSFAKHVLKTFLLPITNAPRLSDGSAASGCRAWCRLPAPFLRPPRPAPQALDQEKKQAAAEEKRREDRPPRARAACAHARGALKVGGGVARACVLGTPLFTRSERADTRIAMACRLCASWFLFRAGRTHCRSLGVPERRQILWFCVFESRVF